MDWSAELLAAKKALQTAEAAATQELWKAMVDSAADASRHAEKMELYAWQQIRKEGTK